MAVYPIEKHGKTVGNCEVTEQGLYWIVTGTCKILSDRVERIYCCGEKIAVLEKDGDSLRCSRMLSKSAYPCLPPADGVFTLEPQKEMHPWNGFVLGKRLEGYCDGDTLLFPYDPQVPCPCEALICFFEIRDGFWRLKARPQWLIEEEKTVLKQTAGSSEARKQ